MLIDSIRAEHRAGEADSFVTANRRILRYLDGAAQLLHGLLIMMMYHSLTEFMGLPRDPISWAAAVALVFVTALATAFWSGVSLALVVLFFTSPLWVSIALRYWPETVDMILEFFARWIIFLAEAYRGTLVGMPVDLGYFTLALILTLLAGWGWTCVRRNAGGLSVVPALGVLLFQWFFFFDTAERYLPLYLLAAGLMVSILQYRRWIRPEHLAVMRRFSLGSVLFSVTALLLLVMTASAIMPDEAPTWSLTRARRWFTSTFPVFDRVRGESGTGTRGATWFSLSLSGYGPATALGGPLQLDHSPGFSLTLQVRFGHVDDLSFPLYLKGRTLGHYTGRGWLPEQDEHWEWFEPGTRLPRLIPPDLRTQQLIQKITPLHLETNTLFAAGDIREVRLPEAALDPSHTGGEVVAKSGYGDVIGYNMLRRDDTYTTLSQVPYWEIDPSALAADDVNLEALGPYLALPDEVPARVRDLAHEIAGDVEGHYHKAQAISRYLRQLPYSLDVYAIPADREFTDHFLFHQQRGYCSYHSTALAVMLRAVGVPTRWVQGFLVSGDDMEEAEDDPELLTGIVPLSSAHAWVDVWLADHGWVPFEATPTFPSIDHTLALPHDPSMPDDGPPADDMDHERPWLPLDPDEELLFPDDDLGPGLPAARTWQQLLILSAAGIATLLVAASTALFFLVRRRDTRIAGRALQSILGSAAASGSPAEQVVLSAVLSISYLSRGLRLPIEGLTPREFAASVADQSDEAGPGFTRLIGIYEQLAYGGQSIPESTGEQAQEIFREIMRTLRKELGLRQYVTRVYLDHLGGMRELIASIL